MTNRPYGRTLLTEPLSQNEIKLNYNINIVDEACHRFLRSLNFQPIPNRAPNVPHLAAVCVITCTVVHVIVSAY